MLINDFFAHLREKNRKKNNFKVEIKVNFQKIEHFTLI
jgi:hypothetical protein